MSALLAFAVVFGIFALSACDKSVKLNGKYEIFSAESGGITLSKDDLAELEMNMTMEFIGNEVTLMGNSGEDASGTYKIEGDQLTISNNGEELTGTLSDENNTITLVETESSVTIVLKKA
ncbi:MAG: hypothetical protein LBK04_02865 [Clostridiales Family XIII bacterium]|nr:hypothetical protein [Clostridiales Family XIII bacterium]